MQEKGGISAEVSHKCQFVLKGGIRDKGTSMGKTGYSFIFITKYKIAC